MLYYVTLASAEAPLGNSRDGGATKLKRIGEQMPQKVTADDSAESSGVDEVMKPESGVGRWDV